MTTGPFIHSLVDSAAAPYRRAGRFAWHFARGKLKADPVFAYLLKQGLLTDRARILDIGCGQGLLASWLLSARTSQEQGKWPADWPPAPQPATFHGIELMPQDVKRAQQALGKFARFTQADMCAAVFEPADAVVILDVLHYVDLASQDGVLQRVRAALPPGGRLILRVGDADGGLAFSCSVWVDRMVTFVRGHRGGRLYCRSLPQWKKTLEGLGFEVISMPMSQGTPFANVLLVAQVPDEH